MTTTKVDSHKRSTNEYRGVVAWRVIVWYVNREERMVDVTDVAELRRLVVVAS